MSCKAISRLLRNDLSLLSSYWSRSIVLRPLSRSIITQPGSTASKFHTSSFQPCGRRNFSKSSQLDHSSNEDEDVQWDDSDWMKHNDGNAEAYEKLDITKLMPFPEYRNIAAGPVWGPDAFEALWKKYYDEQAPGIIAKAQDDQWEKYIEEHGFSPEEYFESADFIERYEGRLIWEDYQRNFKGSRPPQKTRRDCYRRDKIATGNPCPICRDSKILVNYKNIRLLNNFIDPLSGDIHQSLRTGVCRRKQSNLEKAVLLSRDYGFLPKPVGFTKQDIEAYRVDHLAVRPN